MAISQYITNATDQGTLSSGSISLGGPIPDGAAIWVAVARADAHATGAVTTVTDDASPSSNTYTFVQYVDNGGSEPEIELWVADNITGGPSNVSWSAASSVDTSVAVVVFQGQATPSVEDFGTGGALPSTGGTDVLEDSATVANVDDYLVLLAGVDAQSNSITWAGLTVAPTAFTPGSGDSAIAFATGVAGATGSQPAEITGASPASGPTWVYFAAVVAVAATPPTPAAIYVKSKDDVAGTLTADGSEDPLYAPSVQTVDAFVEGYVSLQNMQGGDTVVVNEYVAVDGTNYELLNTQTYSGVQAQPVVRFVGKLVGPTANGAGGGVLWKATLKQTGGVNRTYPYSFALMLLNA